MESREDKTVAETLLTVKDVATRLAIGRTTVYELIANGGLRTIKIGRCRRIPESALDEWIARQVGVQGVPGERGLEMPGRRR
jgi:excisionase family DNA binding protein